MIPTVFPERVWCGLHPEGAHRGERLQHVRISGVEEQEAADVCGSERPREAAEREENPQEEHSHPLPSNCGVNWRAWTGEGGHAALDREVFNTEKKKSCKTKTFTEKSLNWKQGTNTVTQKKIWSLLLILTEIMYFIWGEEMISVFSVARDAIFIRCCFCFFFCAKQFATRVCV